MPIRVVIAGAILVMAISSAAAQTATNAPPGEPIPLLQIVLQQPGRMKSHVKPVAKKFARTTARKKRPAFAAARPRIRMAAARKPHMAKVAAQPHMAKAAARKPHMAKVAAKPHIRIAAARPKHASVRIAAAAAPATVWPQVDAAPLAFAEATAPPPVLAPETLSAIPEPEPSELVVGGETVQVAAADQVNDLDLAADQSNAAAATAPATAAPETVTKSNSAAAEPAARAFVVAPAQQRANPVGRTSWLAQMLAALGGAIAAGSVAWLLIGSRPQRMYG